MLALGYDTGTPVHAPSQGHLRIRTSTLFRNFCDILVYQQGWRSVLSFA